jgi:ABC-type phosphate transport system substrate-binding protein
MTLKKVTSVLALALMFSLSAPPKPSAAVNSDDARSPNQSINLSIHSSLIAQAQPTFTLPDTLPQGSTVRIDGSSAMQVINQALQQNFQKRYPDATVNLDYQGSAQALQALADGKIDLAAIARPLADAEKSQGFTEVSVSRNKIAVIVDPSNPYRGNLTLTDYVKIFRGEITDWSQLGGEAGTIRLVDRPESSDTRQAFGRYLAFSDTGGLTTGASVTQVEDTTDAVIKGLGKDGVGYAIANQVEQRQDVEIVKMHNTLPDDGRYPFSQPLTYVYKGEASPAVAAFLAYATNADGQQVIDQAKEQEAAAAGSATGADSGATAGAATTATGTAAALPPPGAGDDVGAIAGGFPLGWLWLLPLALLGLLLWGWWKRRGVTEEAIAEPPSPPATPIPPLPPAPGQPVDESVDLAARTGSVIAADRVSIGNRPPVIAQEPLPSEQSSNQSQFNQSPSNQLPSNQLPSNQSSAPTAGFDAAAPDTGTAPTVNWGAVGAGAAALGAAALAGRGGSASEQSNVPDADTPADTNVPDTNVPDTNVGVGDEEAIANPVTNLNEANLTAANTTADTTETNITEIATTNPEATPWATSVSSSGDTSTDTSMPSSGTISSANLAMEQNPFSTEPSQPSTPTAPSDAPPSFPAAASLGLGAVAASQAVRPANQTPDQSTVEASRYDVGQTDLSAESLASVDADLPDLPEGYGTSRIVLMPQNPQWAYAYWDVPNDRKQEARQQGGDRLALRFYDVTDIEDLSRQNPHSLQEYECDELARDWYVPIPVSDRDYIAEIGYVTVDGRWLMLARSQPARIPPIYPSDWYEEKFLNVPWDQDLQGKRFVTLLSPTEKRNGSAVALYDMAQGAEAQRLAGSLYGSMQQAAGASESVSSFSMFASGAGMSGVGMSGVGMSGSGLMGYTTSGVGMSGVGMSGVGMSGIGMSGVGMSGVGMSGIGMYSESGVGMYTTSGMGLYTTSGMGLYTESGMGMYTTSGMGLYTESGMGMYTTSGMGLYTTSGMGLYTTSGMGMYTESGVGMYTTSGMGLYSESGVGLYSMSGVGYIGSSASAPPLRPRKFWLVADAELIVYGATEPDAVVTIAGRPVKLNPDGTFRFQMSFQDGLIDFPIMAVAADGEQNRAIHLKFERETPSRRTNTREEATLEWIEDQP